MEDVVIEQESAEGNRKSDAPAQNRGRTVKKRKNRKPSKLWNYVFNLLASCIITFSLLGMDFVLFASSGPFNIYSGTILREEIMSVLIFIGIGIGVLYFCLSFLSPLLYLLSSIVSGLVVFSIFNQFANIHIDGVIGTRWDVYSAIFVAVMMLILTELMSKKIKALVVLTCAFCFGAVLVNQNHERMEYLMEPNPSVLVGAQKEGELAQKNITIMLANAPSYSYINTLNDKEVSKIYKDRLLNIMLGFYIKNGFYMYPNAYITNNNHFVNAARNLNYDAGEDLKFLQNQVRKSGYWQFKNREDFEAYLLKNPVYDNLKQQGYKISAYQSHGINLCKQNDKIAVDRCVRKIDFPVNVDNLPIKGDKTKVLFAQWIESTGLFGDEEFMEKAYGYLSSMFKPDKTPVIGITYKKLYVVNSFKQLDFMLRDLKQDKGNNAYFVYLDLPSDMFIYDDMCRLKKSDNWLIKYHQPWVKNYPTVEKRNAYLLQTMCLFGQLEKVMQEIKELPEAENVTVMIEGLNGMSDMYDSPEQDLGKRFMNNSMVTLAIKKAHNKRVVINKSICPVEEILNHTFNDAPKCEDFSRTRLSKTSKRKIREQLATIKYTNSIARTALKEFTQWYKEWKKANTQAPLKSPLHFQSGAGGESLLTPKAGFLPLDMKNATEQKIKTGEELPDIIPSEKDDLKTVQAPLAQ